MPPTFWKGNDKRPNGHFFSLSIRGFCHLVVLLFNFFLNVNDLDFLSLLEQFLTVVKGLVLYDVDVSEGNQ